MRRRDSWSPAGPASSGSRRRSRGCFPRRARWCCPSDIAGRRRGGCGASSRQIAKGEIDILIGTQLVAKGHNFPHLDPGRRGRRRPRPGHGDPRAAERTFQLLCQVTGRAGRAGERSRALLQTYQPEHPVMQALVSGDREAFYRARDRRARARRLPPFGRLAAGSSSARQTRRRPRAMPAG